LNFYLLNRRNSLGCCPKETAKQPTEFKENKLLPILMWFNRWRLEKNYQRQVDPLYKLYCLCSLIILICIGLVEIISKPEYVQKSIFLNNFVKMWTELIFFSSCRFNSMYWIMYMAILLLLLILTPILWTVYLWLNFRDSRWEQNKADIKLPENRLIGRFYKCATFVKTYWPIRIALYLVICLLISLLSVANLVK